MPAPELLRNGRVFPGISGIYLEITNLNSTQNMGIYEVKRSRIASKKRTTFGQSRALFNP